MKLFIASTLADSIDLLLMRVAPGPVLFITNPADPYKSKYWMKKDVDAFLTHGFPVDQIDLRTIDAADLEHAIGMHDFLHVCGGSAIYVLRLLREKKMDPVIVDAVMKGRIIYTSTSAGSEIAGPNIGILADDIDEKVVKMKVKRSELKGLCLVPYLMFCHSQDRYYVKSTQKAMKGLPKNKTPLLMLNDNMAVWHENGSMTIQTLR